MPNTLQLIEQVRRKVPRHTDYAVAKALEMGQSNFARVLVGKAGLGPKAVLRVSEILQRDVRDVLVLVEEDKAKTPKERAFWERRSPRITATIALAILAFGIAVTTTSRSTEAVHPYSLGFPFYTLCELLATILLDKFRKVWARQPQSRLSLIATV
jgi:Phage related protein